jgi:multicomponent Na+:H+ antiporter subunit D
MSPLASAAGAPSGVDASALLPFIVVTPMLGAAVLAVTGRLLPRATADALAAVLAAVPAALASLALFAGRGGAAHSPYAVQWLGGWRPGGNGQGVGIVLVGDPVSLGLAAFASLLVVAVLAYACRYFQEPPPSRTPGAFPALVLLFQSGMCGFCLTGDLFDAFVFFELMGVVAYALTGFRVEEPRPVHGALAFGIVNSLGGYALLLGIGLLYARTGELGLAQLGRRLDHSRPDAAVLAGFVLIAVGLLVKAAAVPFHFWLPDAHAVAPTPVCMLLSGVMVELGAYGVGRVYWTVFAGPGGVPHEAASRALLTVGVLTALLGAAMCWQQRHLKRLLAFSTVAHTGLFLIALGVLTPQGAAGTAVYVLAHGGVKAALFACTGVLLDRFSSVDEQELYGRGRTRELRVTGALFGLGGLALCGLPPFGTSLGKGVAEEAVGHTGYWLTAVFVLVSAVTGGAVLRAWLRVFLGAGPAPREEGEREVRRGRDGLAGGRAGSGPQGGEEEAGDASDGGPTRGDEYPETATQLRHVPATMLAVPALLLAAALAAGVVPELAEGATRAGQLFASHHAYADAVLDGRPPGTGAGVPPSHWSAVGVLLGLLSAALGAVFALLGALRALPGSAGKPLAPWRRLQSGHIGDYVAWVVAGIALLAVLTAPGTLPSL